MQLFVHLKLDEKEETDSRWWLEPPHNPLLQWNVDLLKMYSLFKMGIFQPAMLLYRSVPHWKTCDKLCQIFPKICRTSMGIQTHIPVILSTESREVIFGILMEVWSSNLGKPCVGVWLWLPANGTRKVNKVALYEAKLMRLSLSNINQSSKFRPKWGILSCFRVKIEDANQAENYQIW